MSAKLNPRIGDTYGRLTAIQFLREGTQTGHAHSYWLFQCVCGNKVEVRLCHVRSGHTTSCGCYNKERIVETQTTHGMRTFPEYKVWAQMLQRCNNENDSKFYLYGARGIKVDPSWVSFETFYYDMGPRPSDEYSLDRKDNNGNYCAENCRWATPTEQSNNRRAWGTVIK